MNSYFCPTCRIDIRRSVATDDVKRVQSMSGDTDSDSHEVPEQPCALCARLIKEVCESHKLSPDSPEIEQLLSSRRHYYLHALHENSGGLDSIPPRLRAATMDRIPEPIRDILNKRDFQNQLCATIQIPKLGLGLSAKARSGKSSALAALAIYRRRRVAVHHALRDITQDDRTNIVWLDWPAVALRVNTDHKGDEIPHLTVWAGKAELLILDDIGLEGGTTWPNGDPKPSTLLLQNLIRQRHDKGAPIWWTTNGTASDITTRYGDAVADRLMNLAPLHELDLAQHPDN